MKWNSKGPNFKWNRPWNDAEVAAAREVDAEAAEVAAAEEVPVPDKGHRPCRSAVPELRDPSDNQISL